MKIRTIITQDAEVDDQNSLRHFLFYANEVDLQGIVQTSSKFHWIGVPGAVKPEKKFLDDFDKDFVDNSGPFDQPYRWPGTDWMMRVIDDYEKDYPCLTLHADGYPTPEYLRSITKVGNIGYEGEVEGPTEGSELIRERILDDDERTLYLQVWGGTNTIARALMDIETEYKDTPEWPALHEKITKKVVITACGEQDGAYRNYVAEVWPGIQFVKTLQMRSYAYPWFVMPEGESKDSLRAEFMKSQILTGKSALADGYCTWMDGHHYEGEGPDGQFGSNMNIANEWFGAKMGMPKPVPYDFLSEGDSPTYILLFPWGFRTLENFAYGGMAGRYHKVEGEVNSKGEPLNLWDVSMDSYTDRDGNVSEVESMWPYVVDVQRDFAARVHWAYADRFRKGEHAPTLGILEGTDITAAPGEVVTLHAQAASPDRDSEITVSFRYYKEASAEGLGDVVVNSADRAALVTIPADAPSGAQIHIIVKAQAGGRFKLVHYQQVIITVK